MDNTTIKIIEDLTYLKYEKNKKGIKNIIPLNQKNSLKTYK